MQTRWHAKEGKRKSHEEQNKKKTRGKKRNAVGYLESRAWKLQRKKGVRKRTKVPPGGSTLVIA